MQQQITDLYQQHKPTEAVLANFTGKALENFTSWGIPTVKHEEWKYTRIGAVLTNKLIPATVTTSLTAADIDAFRLPQHEAANELVFVNGYFQPQLSNIRSSEAELVVMPLLEAATDERYATVVKENLGHSSNYLKDGVNALNNVFAHQGLFIAIPRNKVVEAPIYCYYINDARGVNVLAQPRVLMHVGINAQVNVVEENVTLGTTDTFTNKVCEVVVEDNATVNFYQFQNEDSHSNHAVTTHFRQVGVSKVNVVTITLNGGVIRNNLNLVLAAPGCESHMYGLYLVKGNTHIDNHTIVDNVEPNSFSNELYKGIMDENSTGVFNGKIFVRQDAQKTNAYQSNKNVLLSDTASVNTKPQLEIFADDVKCSHGCTVGRLDEEAMFYLRSRGIDTVNARALLLHAFAMDILEKIELEPVRAYVDQLISERLGFEY